MHAQQNPHTENEPTDSSHQFYLVDGSFKRGFDHIGDLMDAIAEAAVGSIENGDTFTVEIKHDTDHRTPQENPCAKDQVVRIITASGPSFCIRIPGEVIVDDFATDIYSFIEQHLKNWESWRFPEENSMTGKIIKISPESGPAFYTEIPPGTVCDFYFLNTYFQNVDVWKYEA